MTHFKIVRYPTEDHAGMDTAIFGAFLRASEGKDLQALMGAMRSGKRLNQEIEGVVTRLLAEDRSVHNTAKALGWEIVRDALLLEDEAAYSGLDLIGVSEGRLDSGKSVADHTAGLGAGLGYADAKYLLDNAERLLPKSWEAEVIVFPGTVCRDKEGIDWLPCISKDRNWQVTFHPAHAIRMNYQTLRRTPA